MSQYLVVFESSSPRHGQNGMPHILKGSVVVEAESGAEANRKARDGDFIGSGSTKFSGPMLHYGKPGDYCTVIDIKKIE